MKNLIYTVLANIIAIVHGLFVVYVVSGGLVALKWPVTVWVHLPIALYGVLIMIFEWTCPLTRWEILLREKAGEHVQWTEYLDHYLFSNLGLTGSEWFVMVALVVAILVFNYYPYRQAFGA